MSSAMNTEPPSAAKAELIRQFLRLSGIQRQIDEGDFFSRHAKPGGAVFGALPGDTAYGDTFEAARRALCTAYEPHRQTWQAEYDDHLNWEFTENELQEIIAFLGSAAGKHYQEGLLRMRAYIGTNTGELVEQIVSEACKIAAGDDSAR
jgi:hypothetical protein